LEYLQEKGNLYGKEILLHPIIETYVNLRSYKYNRVYQWNYFAFILIFILPFVPLMLFNHRYKGKIDYWNHWGWEKLHYISIFYMMAREFFQFFLEDKKVNYFKHKSNWLEVILISTTIVLSVCSSWFYHRNTIVLLEIFFTLTTTVSATTLNFLTKDPVYFKILKKITMVFLKIMHVFIVILLGLAYCIYIVLEGNDVDSESSYENPFAQEPEAEPEVIRPFVSSFLKVLTMLSGEYSLDLNFLNSFQLIFCVFFVIASFILFNLIVGISFEKIEDIMSESRQLNVLDKMKKLIEMEEKFDKIKVHT
jgi:hypothetical protein